jgi:hypothetical protein
MVTKAASKGLVGKVQKTLMVALAALVLLVSLPLHRAEAWQYLPVTGTSGAVGVPTICVREITHVIRSGRYNVPIVVRELSLTSCTGTGPTVYRSPASTGSQTIRYQYFVERWDGSRWVITTTSNVTTYQIAATQSYINLPAPNLQPRVQGHLRFTWAFDWYRNGVLLGGTFVVSHLASDYQCQLPNNRCLLYPGYFYVSGF